MADAYAYTGTPGAYYDNTGSLTAEIAFQDITTACVRQVQVLAGVVAQVVDPGGCFSQSGATSSVPADVAVNGLVLHRLDSSASISVDSSAQTLTSSGGLQVEAAASGSTGLLAGTVVPLETLAAPARFDIAAAASNGLQFPSLSNAALFGLPLSFGVYGQFGAQATTDLSSVASLKLFGPSIDGAVDLTTDNTQLLQVTSLHFDVNGGDSGGSSSSSGSGGGSGTGGQPGKHYRVHSIYNCSKAPPTGFKCVPDSRVRFKGGGFLQRDDGDEPSLGRAFPVRNVTIDYMAPFGSPQLGEWSGSGTVDLASVFPGVLKKIAPTLTLGLSFYASPFRFSGASGKLDNVNIPIGEFVFLNSLNANFHLPHPGSQDVQIGGGLGLSAGPKLGRFKALGVDGNFSYQHGRRSGFDMNVSGNVSAAELTLASGHIDYDARDGGSKVSFGGQIGGTYGPSWAHIQPQGNIDGEVTSKHWEASGNVAVKVQLGPVGGGPTGTVLVSDQGFGLCAHLDAVFFQGEVGFAHKWGRDWRFFTCDFSGLEPLYPVHTSAVSGRQTVRVPRGLGAIELAVSAPTGPPQVTLVGPGGRRILSPAQPDQFVNADGALTLAESASSTTYFLIDHPPAGVWRVSPAAGQSGPLSVKIATPLPRLRAHARVIGHRRRRTLIWRLPRVPGIDYVLEEQGPHLLARIHHPVTRSGQAQFRPAAGPAGRRTIRVLVERDGLPVRTIVAGHYNAPGTPLPAGPRSARYQLRRKTLTISWTPVRRAIGYLVTITQPRRPFNMITLAASTRHTVVQLTTKKIRRITVNAIVNGVTSRTTTARR